MEFKRKILQYERMEFSKINKAEPFDIIRPDGKTDTVIPFKYQPVVFMYDEHGYENIVADGEMELRARYTPIMKGVYYIGDELFEVCDSYSHGYISQSKKDCRYFEYDDGTTYLPIGLNMAFPKAYEISSGVEFGVTTKKAYLGLKQYKRWFELCARNGVNLVRLWIGHPYFTPDTEEIYELDYKKFTLLDTIVDMAREKGIKLKLTLEQFRYFEYEKEQVSYEAFSKKLYYKGMSCPNKTEWLKDGMWQEGWFYKIRELSKRYSGDTTIFAVELWNEMNCFGDMAEWSRKKLPEVKKLFPKHLVTNSYGSLDCEETISLYHHYCWDKTDIVQLHRYVDQGAHLSICNHPIDMIKDGVAQLLNYGKPVLVAETGAVNNCHSSHFRFYSSDDCGIIFADTVYTPVFCGSCGTGNIWHWDDRYLESKGLYKMYKPIADLCANVDFLNEQFEIIDYSNERVHMHALSGKTTVLIYIRNKKADWQNVLRDGHEPEVISKIDLPEIMRKTEIVSIWDIETAFLQGNILYDLKYGVFIKGRK